MFLQLIRRLDMLEKIVWWIEAMWRRHKLIRKLKKMP